ncbi:hypothetical protein CYLTODRAFT_492416 [Cylindrobasidium torrendii FP15055 ss-10]|uniref:Uncharacterized protein n=1 Tax=Cylindrobasidium torrendii FP15055 ss-10 TaxID=1314674 RepID=A0A0D7B714_9AGAR|nr:hypothetical protein CYLTODRAFT_492416 [Cylindrobasidium torrendii FP15055 ss-10]
MDSTDTNHDAASRPAPRHNVGKPRAFLAALEQSMRGAQLAAGDKQGNSTFAIVENSGVADSTTEPLTTNVLPSTHSTTHASEIRSPNRNEPVPETTSTSATTEPGDNTSTDKKASKKHKARRGKNSGNQEPPSQTELFVNANNIKHHAPDSKSNLETTSSTNTISPDGSLYSSIHAPLAGPQSNQPFRRDEVNFGKDTTDEHRAKQPSTQASTEPARSTTEKLSPKGVSPVSSPATEKPRGKVDFSAARAALGIPGAKTRRSTGERRLSTDAAPTPVEQESVPQDALVSTSDQSGRGRGRGDTERGRGRGNRGRGRGRGQDRP